MEAAAAAGAAAVAAVAAVAAAAVAVTVAERRAGFGADAGRTASSTSSSSASLMIRRGSYWRGSSFRQSTSSISGPTSSRSCSLAPVAIRRSSRTRRASWEAYSGRRSGPRMATARIASTMSSLPFIPNTFEGYLFPEETSHSENGLTVIPRLRQEPTGRAGSAVQQCLPRPRGEPAGVQTHSVRVR